METLTVPELAQTKPLQRVISNQEYTVTFLTTAAESRNRLTEMEVVLLPGGGNELHTHLNFAETFIPIKGTLEVQLGSKKLLLEPGEKCTVPVGVPHNFTNPGNKPVHFRVVIEPGHEGFEYSLRMLYGLANAGRADIRNWDDLMSVAVILGISEMRLCGKKAILNPFIPLLYRVARRKGIEEEMIRKYCV
ncbi:MAG: cupin domain-containing protein [Dyadobacter fermentans]